MRIASELLEQVVEHARRDAPNECCGIVGMRDGAAVSVHEVENTTPSPFRFDMDGVALYKLLDELEDADAIPGLIYHSHTRSEAYPSQTDINFAAHWPGWEWLIVGLAKGRLTTRCYVIEGGEVHEVEVEVA